MGRFVIVAYKPREGKDAELLGLVREHVPVLRGLGMVTERQPYIMRSKDGVILEVFEWKSEVTHEQMHTNPVILEMWGRFEKACEYVTLPSIPECQGLFASFESASL
jgi:hypothetical protein